ncbi:MAG: nucleoside triphosphate pyrophosphatase [Solirubrobacteraceae bacterium]|nr:nucleoside triphosphate pyrophosphatase [Solirubrobacteraceae bacterium]
MAGPEPSSGEERLVLASRSPQRRAILEQLGIPFTVRVTEAVEEDAGSPRAVANENALRKALAGRAAPGEIVLGVDTLVATGVEIWGKPPSEEAARETLRRLAGRTHEVVSGVAIVDADGAVTSATAVTRVTFRALDAAAIEWYLATGEWRERAGGYAIQGRGAALVERIEGDYLNVVGLPVATLVDLRPSVLPMGR